MSFVGAAGVIGWPVAHSKSPLIHRFWLAKLGLDGDYGRLPVVPERLGDAIRALPALGLRGVNVTVPHKQAVIPFLDRLDPLAEQVGAVNTVVVEGGGLVGYNTDVAGFMEPLVPLLGGRAEQARLALVIGAGGAARAIGYGLTHAGFSVSFLNRDAEKARALTSELGGHEWPAAAGFDLATDQVPRLGRSPRNARCDVLLVNATSLGAAGNAPLDIALDRIDNDAIVFDIVYTPLETPLLAAARARGMRTIDGLQMLVAQAAAAFALFFGHPAPREFDAELRALLIA